MLNGGTVQGRFPSAKAPTATRDLRIDWLRGLAMTLVIVNHSKLASLLSWFSYERFWVVTAAEVFVVLSGVVLGMVYGRRFARDGWQAVVRGLGRRALVLYGSFVAVTLSVLFIAWIGVDVHALMRPPDAASAWLIDPRQMDRTAWAAVLFMRSGPWAFEIVGMYVWLVVAAVPCLIVLRVAGWRVLLAVSWALYLAYQIAPLRLTSSEFESVFPLLAWQLLFVHGITIGYHRDSIGRLVSRRPSMLPIAAAATSAFLLFALCNPWTDGPSWLHLRLISAERFTFLYGHYFKLTDLGIGRLLNLAVALPVGYVLLTWGWPIAQRTAMVFVTLGQQSLGAFVLHVYGILLLDRVPHGDGLVLNTIVQIALVVAIAAALYGMTRVRRPRRRAAAPEIERLAA